MQRIGLINNYMPGSKTTKKNFSRKKSRKSKEITGSKKIKKKSSNVRKNSGSKIGKKSPLYRRSSNSKRKFIKKVKWNGIPGFTKYEASTDGQIRNCFTEKVLKPSLVGGYYEIALSGDRERITY